MKDFNSFFHNDIDSIPADERDNIDVNPSNNQKIALQPEKRALLSTAMLTGILGGLSNLSMTRSFAQTKTQNKQNLKNKSKKITFKPIAVSDEDTVKIPEGYKMQVLYRWGDAIGHHSQVAGAPAFKYDASNTSAEQALQAGMHHDGMHFFTFPNTQGTSGVLMMNHEYMDDSLLFPDGQENWTKEKTEKSKNAVGNSIIEVKRDRRKGWQVVRPSKYARRLTMNTPMTISGPAAGHTDMKTSYDTTGKMVYGTYQNCALGWTPWGTYLGCEENVDGCFIHKETKGKRTAHQNRYGIRSKSYSLWHTTDDRFDLEKEPNEFNRFGWVVETDPFNPDSTPVKRTAMGRFKHEGAAYRIEQDGRLSYYMGDDQIFEYYYKFVTKNAYNPKNREANKNLLDEGTLYAAKFTDVIDPKDGSKKRKVGQWLALEFGQNGLTPENGFNNQGEVLIKTRQAADTAGATKMDRTEWTTVNPKTGEAFVTCTMNKERGTKGNEGANPANPRDPNPFGHIIRVAETPEKGENYFVWDIYMMGGVTPQSNPEIKEAHLIGDSGGDGTGDLFACPDGLAFDNRGLLWIGTDIAPYDLNNEKYIPFGNNQLLCSDPETMEVKRFLTGPKGCEITGITITDNCRTLFVNVQHPGEIKDGNNPKNPTKFSDWPDHKGFRPRSATIVIEKIDGGLLGG